MGLDRNERHPLLCRASNEITSIRNSLPFGMAAEHHPRPRWPNLYLPLIQQCFGFVPIFTRGLASTPWYGTSKVHYEQLRRIGRQSSKLQFIRIRIDAKQLIVVNMLTCSGVPGGGIFASKHSSNKIGAPNKSRFEAPHDREYKAAALLHPNRTPLSNTPRWLLGMVWPESFSATRRRL